MSQDTVAIIGGTGDQGLGLALRWAKAGVRVCIGSRKPDRALEAAMKVKKLVGTNAPVEAKENLAAAMAANIVVVTVPYAAHYGILKAIRPGISTGKTLVDVTVPLASSLGGPPTLTVGVWEGSAAEQAARLVPNGVQVAAAFNNVSASALMELGSPVDCDVIVCTDHEEARERCFSLCRKIPGLHPVNGGRLENARIVESITALLISLNVKHKVDKAGIRITGLPRS